MVVHRFAIENAPLRQNHQLLLGQDKLDTTAVIRPKTSSRQSSRCLACLVMFHVQRGAQKGNAGNDFSHSAGHNYGRIMQTHRACGRKPPFQARQKYARSRA